MPPVLRFGIIGLGIASTQIVPAMQRLPQIALTAACDIRKEGLEKFQQEVGGGTYQDVEQLCKSPNVDAVYVCSPNRLHAQHVITAAEHRKHVIVEKPMALSLDECEAMNAAAERNGVQLLCGHTKSFDPPIRKMREIVKSGELGPLRMINTWHFNEFMYRPRMPQELDPAQGGNIIFNQGPHQMDIVRLIGGGLVRSVRGVTGIWDRARNAEGAYSGFLEFEDGTPATAVYNGYGHFDTAELTWWAGEQPRDPDYNLRRRQALSSAAAPEQEWAMKDAERYGGAAERRYHSRSERPHSIFGLTVVSCERGDIRQMPDGLKIYGDDAYWEVPVPKPEGSGREAELIELYDAVVHERPVQHDGRWGEATLEVVLAIMQSSRDRAEVLMGHQVPSPE